MDIFDHFLWGAMPHKHCIANPIIVWGIFFTCLAISFQYMKFRTLNKQILASHAGNQFFKTAATFRGFSNVFMFCAINYLMMAINLHTKAYFVALVFMIIDLYWITYTVNQYRNNLPDFMAQPMPEDLVDATEPDLRAMVSTLRLKLKMMETKELINQNK